MMGKDVTRLAIVLTCTCFITMAGCQHATDDSEVEPERTLDQSEQATALFRMPLVDKHQFLHFGFDGDRNWSIFVRDEPLSTALEPHGSGPGESSPGDLTTARQSQNSGVFGGLLGPSGGPKYDATAAFGAQFSAAAPGAERFSAEAPGSDRASVGNPQVDGTGGREFTATVSDGAGQSCSMRSLCSFIESICRVRPTALDSASSIFHCRSTSQCHRLADELNDYISARTSRDRLCRAAGLFECAARHMRRAGDSVPFEQYDDGYSLNYLIHPTFNHCFRRQNLVPYSERDPEEYNVDPSP